MGLATGRGISQFLVGGERFLDHHEGENKFHLSEGERGGLRDKNGKFSKILAILNKKKSFFRPPLADNQLEGGTVVNMLLVWGEHFFGRPGGGGYSPPFPSPLPTYGLPSLHITWDRERGWGRLGEKERGC